MLFELVPDELKHVAESCAAWLEARGYSVTEADDDLSYPCTPSMSARRESALSILEVVDALDVARLTEWTLYGKACGSEIRVIVCLDTSCSSRDEVVLFATANGLGVYVVEDGVARELLEPRDLAATVVVPGLANEEQYIRMALGNAVEEYERTNWQDGLRNATRGFEQLCRERLKQLV